MQQSIGINFFLCGCFGSHIQQLEAVDVHAGAGAAQDDIVVQSCDGCTGGQCNALITNGQNQAICSFSKAELYRNRSAGAVNDGCGSHQVRSSRPAAVQRAGHLEQMLNRQSCGRICLLNNILDAVGLTCLECVVETDDGATPATLVGNDHLAVLDGNVDNAIAAITMLGKDVTVAIEFAIVVHLDLTCIVKGQVQQSIGINFFCRSGLCQLDQIEVIDIQAGAGATQDDIVVQGCQRCTGGQSAALIAADQSNLAIYILKAKLDGDLHTIALDHSCRGHAVRCCGPAAVQRTGHLEQVLNGQSCRRICLLNGVFNAIGLTNLKTVVEADNGAPPTTLVGNDHLSVLDRNVDNAIAAITMLGKDVTIAIELAIAIGHDLGGVREVQTQQCFLVCNCVYGDSCEDYGCQHTYS